jgi:hypothetical protein
MSVCLCLGNCDGSCSNEGLAVIICGDGNMKKVMRGCVNTARCEHDGTWGGPLAPGSSRYTNMHRHSTQHLHTSAGARCGAGGLVPTVRHSHIGADIGFRLPETG